MADFGQFLCLDGLYFILSCFLFISAMVQFLDVNSHFTPSPSSNDWIQYHNLQRKLPQQREPTTNVTKPALSNLVLRSLILVPSNHVKWLTLAFTATMWRFAITTSKSNSSFSRLNNIKCKKTTTKTSKRPLNTTGRNRRSCARNNQRTIPPPRNHILHPFPRPTGHRSDSSGEEDCPEHESEGSAAKVDFMGGWGMYCDCVSHFGLWDDELVRVMWCLVVRI